MRSLVLTILLTVMGFAAAIASDIGALTLSASYAPTRINVTGVTPGADVLFFGAGLEPKRTHAVHHRWATVVTDTDHDGIVTFDFGSTITWNAFWVVADLRTGQYNIVTTPGYPARKPAYKRSELKRDAHGSVSRFRYGGSAGDGLYLAPGGAWTAFVSDGDPNDEATNYGSVMVDLSHMEPLLDGHARPLAFTPGGTLFFIDAQTIELLQLKVDDAGLAGAR
jgi:hypothetical protein